MTASSRAHSQLADESLLGLLHSLLRAWFTTIEAAWEHADELLFGDDGWMVR